METKLRFYKNKEGNKVYTLKEEMNGIKTESPHYKFIKLRDAPKDNNINKEKNKETF